eukprot:scaffold7807_cov95-Skeletonema_dohrnii-CCMP3373.AAC.6
MAPTALRNIKITWIDDKTTSGVLDGCIVVERRRSSFITRRKRYYSCITAESVYVWGKWETTTIIEESELRMHMMKQCTVDKLLRIKDDVYLVAVELMGGGLVYRLCPT